MMWSDVHFRPTKYFSRYCYLIHQNEYVAVILARLFWLLGYTHVVKLIEIFMFLITRDSLHCCKNKCLSSLMSWKSFLLIATWPPLFDKKKTQCLRLWGTIQMTVRKKDLHENQCFSNFHLVDFFKYWLNLNIKFETDRQISTYWDR